MNQVDSYMLLLTALTAAYLFAQFLNYIYRCNVNFKRKQLLKVQKLLKAQQFDELFIRKCQILFEDAMNYYYTLAINSPEVIANELAEHHISSLKESNRIVELYSKLKKRA